jgi:hypothetical protein
MEKIFHNQTDFDANEVNINDYVPNFFTVLPENENDILNKTYIGEAIAIIPTNNDNERDFKNFKDPEICKNLNYILNEEANKK